MRSIRVWLMRVAALFASTRRDRDLADEIESHLQLHIEDVMRRGKTFDEAKREALIAFGRTRGRKI